MFWSFLWHLSNITFSRQQKQDFFFVTKTIKRKKCCSVVPHYGQVAGRLHVEVVRVGGGLEDNMAGGDETDNNQDTEFQDRKLVCMVRWLYEQRGVQLYTPDS